MTTLEEAKFLMEWLQEHGTLGQGRMTTEGKTNISPSTSEMGPRITGNGNSKLAS